MKGSRLKRQPYAPYDSIYITFWKGQRIGTKEQQISNVSQAGEVKKLTTKSQRECFEVTEMFYIMIVAVVLVIQLDATDKIHKLYTKNGKCYCM